MEKENSKDHFLFLDLIRYLAASIVALTHYEIYFLDQYRFEILTILAVEVFFVLSGFVLAKQIIYVVNGKKFYNYKIFLIRRWIRTIPPYFIAIICSTILLGYGDLKNLIKHLFYLQNFISDTPSYNFFSVGWSLSVEEWFYIFFPIYLMLMCKIKLLKENLIRNTLILLLIYFFLRLIFEFEHGWGENVRRSVLFRLDSIAYGFLAYLIRDQIGKKSILLFFFIGLIFFIHISSNKTLLNYSSFFQQSFFIITGTFFGTALLILSRIKINSKNIQTIFDFLARISYPIYLFHIIFLTSMIKFSFNIGIVSYFLVVNIFAFIFHYTVEFSLLKSRPMYS